MHEVRLVGDIAGRRVEGRIKDGRTHFEGDPDAVALAHGPATRPRRAMGASRPRRTTCRHVPCASLTRSE